jgi:hypothetical protein
MEETMRVIVPLILAILLLAFPAFGQSAGQASGITAAELNPQPPMPDNSPMPVGIPTGSRMYPNPANCGTPDEPKACPARTRHTAARS